MSEDIESRLRACADDPMWAAHAEVPKGLCRAAADEIEALKDRARRLEEQLYLAELDASIAGTETGQYWRGNDDGCAGTMRVWEQALTDEIPKPGVLGDGRMEALYRRTEALRAAIARTMAGIDGNLEAIAALQDPPIVGYIERQEAISGFADFLRVLRAALQVTPPGPAAPDA